MNVCMLFDRLMGKKHQQVDTMFDTLCSEVQEKKGSDYYGALKSAVDRYKELSFCPDIPLVGESLADFNRLLALYDSKDPETDGKKALDDGFPFYIVYEIVGAAVEDRDEKIRQYKAIFYEECPICTDSLVQDIICLSCCTRYYHEGCLSEWAQGKNIVCPKCRQNIDYKREVALWKAFLASNKDLEEKRRQIEEDHKLALSLQEQLV